MLSTDFLFLDMKSGNCPFVDTKYRHCYGDEPSTCVLDYDCSGKQRCCYDGCASACVEVVMMNETGNMSHVMRKPGVRRRICHYLMNRLNKTESAVFNLCISKGSLSDEPHHESLLMP